LCAADAFIVNSCSVSTEVTGHLLHCKGIVGFEKKDKLVFFGSE